MIEPSDKMFEKAAMDAEGEADFDLRNAADKLYAACSNIASAAQYADHPREYVEDPTFNPTAHVAITVTIADLRLLYKAIACAEGEKL